MDVNLSEVIPLRPRAIPVGTWLQALSNQHFSAPWELSDLILNQPQSPLFPHFEDQKTETESKINFPIDTQP